jgi:hypothetical protein
LETPVDEPLRGSGEASFGVDEGFGMGNRVERLIHQHSTQRAWGTSTSRVYVRSARTKICMVQSEVMLYLRISNLFRDARFKKAVTRLRVGVRQQPEKLKSTTHLASFPLRRDGVKPIPQGLGDHHHQTYPRGKPVFIVGGLGSLSRLFCLLYIIQNVSVLTGKRA